MLKLEKRLVEYIELREAIFAREVYLPDMTGKLSSQAKARINRRLLSRGFIYIHFDSPQFQLELADSFTPLEVKRRTDRFYLPGHKGGVERRLDETLDRNIPYYPQISHEENLVKSQLSLLISEHKSGQGNAFRELTGEELESLLALHRLSSGASEQELVSGTSASRSTRLPYT